MGIIKKILIVLISIMSLSIAGCSASAKIYEENMKLGFEELERDELSEAETFFKKALEEKTDDDKVSVLIKQIQDYQQMQKELELGNLEGAMEWTEKVLEVENGSDLLVENGVEVQDQILRLESEQESYLAIYEKAKKQLSHQSFDESLKTLETLLKEDFSHATHADLKKDIEELKKEVIESKEKERLAAELATKKAKQEEESRNNASNDISPFGGYWLKDTMACHITNDFTSCALAESDFITYDEIETFNHINDSLIEIVYKDGTKFTLELVDKNSLQLADGVYDRVSKEEANAIYNGYYELP